MHTIIWAMKDAYPTSSRIELAFVVHGKRVRCSNAASAAFLAVSGTYLPRDRLTIENELFGYQKSMLCQLSTFGGILAESNRDSS